MYQITFTHRDKRGVDVDHPGLDAVFGDMAQEHETLDAVYEALQNLNAAWAEIQALEGWETVPTFSIEEMEQ